MIKVRSVLRSQLVGGLWLSLVERCTGGAEVAGSNPVSPTCNQQPVAMIRGGLFFWLLLGLGSLASFGLHLRVFETRLDRFLHQNLSVFVSPLPKRNETRCVALGQLRRLSISFADS